MLRRLNGRLDRFLNARAMQAAKAGSPADPAKLRRSEWPGSLESPRDFYLECFRYFHARLPSRLVQHRAYFTQNRRGFGEDAFHVMWFLLYEEFGFNDFLEIGIYRGQVLSLVSLLQTASGHPQPVCGISPFSAAGDSVSRYLEEVDYLADTLANFRSFGLPQPELIKAYSTDPVAQEKIASRTWDCIYIDGCHDYEVAAIDWANCSRAVKPGGLIVLDDSGLTTRYVPPRFAFAGHPGPSRVAAEVDRELFDEILQVGHNRVFQKKQN
ncbi:MAG: class I SAM-dependent methyltransferase [Acidobacteriota bacterium]|nr:class I SAM-dependent methyltransferase [Acidobacteriota bacterium]